MWQHSFCSVEADVTGATWKDHLPNCPHLLEKNKLIYVPMIAYNNLFEKPVEMF